MNKNSPDLDELAYADFNGVLGSYLNPVVLKIQVSKYSYVTRRTPGKIILSYDFYMQYYNNKTSIYMLIISILWSGII